MFVNVDETAIYFETSLTRTVHLTGSNTIAILGAGSSRIRLTACIAVPSDGTQLPLLVIFKVQPMRHIGKTFTQHSSQRRTWMLSIERLDGSKWNENSGWKNMEIIRPKRPPKFYLLLTDIICYKHSTTVGLLREVDTDTAFITGGYTYTCTPAMWCWHNEIIKKYYA